jgi:catechol 2,3-dioxygenase-like lactoylglutathione lyase family enzyme
VLELISAPANSGPATGRGLDHIRVAVKDFNAESVRRVLRERGIPAQDGTAPGSVRIADPDGMPIELAAAN